MKLLLLLLVIILLLLFGTTAYSLNNNHRHYIINNELDEFIKKELSQVASPPPGVSVAVIQNETILFQGAYGYANPKSKVRNTLDTLFMQASVSKTVMASTLMQLYDQNLFQLDDDINDYLPFSVRNPHHPNDKITFEHLLTHSSGISDDAYQNSWYVKGDSPITLHDILEGYLTPSGKYYQSYSWHNYKPGYKYDYSNIGASLAGYLAQVISDKQTFDQSALENILDPLHHNESIGFFLSDINDVNKIAIPSFYNENNGKYVEYCNYGYPDYPDGQLRTNIIDQAKFFMNFVNFGIYKGVRLLKESTVKLMRKIVNFCKNCESNLQGLIWYGRMQKNRLLLGHNGSDEGVSTEMFFNPKTGVGYLIMSNGDWDMDLFSTAVTKIEKKILTLYDPNGADDKYKYHIDTPRSQILRHHRPKRTKQSPASYHVECKLPCNMPCF